MTREELHARSIQMRGYRRSDGLFEVEAVLFDNKPFDFRPISDKRVVPAGQAIHHMRLRIVFDRQLTVHDVIAHADAFPYADCAGGPATLKSLVGLKMSSGWSLEVKKRLAGAASCTHFAGLMVPLAATAFQTLAGVRTHETPAVGPDGRPVQLDSCLAYSHSGQIVRWHWPAYFRDEPVKPASASR